MSLIEKIDAEIAKLGNRIEQYENGNKMAYGISVGLKRAKEIILSEQKEPIGNSEQLTEQKEPCDFCKNIYTIESTSYTYTEPIASLYGLSENNYCPKCSRPLNQPSATDNNVVTIGDKIRESNRSLAYMLGSLCSHGATDIKTFEMRGWTTKKWLDYLNQPYME